VNEASQNIANIPALLSDVYDRFRTGRFEESESLLEEALTLDFEHEEVLVALKSAHFWRERVQRVDALDDDFERGEYLTNQWKAFVGFLRVKDVAPERAMFAVKQWVFGRALGCYLRVLEVTSGRDPELLFRIGSCYKGKGNYKQALEHFEASSHQRSDDPHILAELADCYALINEMSASKVFFREAFYLDPQQIELDSMECTMMRRLIEQVVALGKGGPDLLEWLPVYGVVYGVFNVKRELRSLEYGKLKQSIYALESSLADEGKGDGATVPKLLNRYFWLIDHYLAAGDDREKIDDALAKIRDINSSIYDQYIN